MSAKAAAGPDPAAAGELVALARPVRVRRRVGATVAEVLVAAGDPVGEIADDDTRDHLLRTGAIGRPGGVPYVHAPHRS